MDKICIVCSVKHLCLQVFESVLQCIHFKYFVLEDMGIRKCLNKKIRELNESLERLDLISRGSLSLS